MAENKSCPDFSGGDSSTSSALYYFNLQNLDLTDTYSMFFCLLICTIAVAQFFGWIRKFVFSDKSNLDTDFDAGGKVSIGLTATTIVSQWTWAATLLQSSSVAAKYGVSGPFWYAAGATIQILLFSMISVQLKIRAPGAKTFLRVIMARFGRRTHMVFCVFALATNVIVTAMLMLGGTAVMTTLVEGLSVELATALVAAVMGTYTFIGGLGATFYVAYFNTLLLYVIMIIFLAKVYFDPSESNPLGSIEKVYDLLTCSTGPSDNKDGSYLTLLSYQGLLFGIINIVGNFGTVFVDQSYWQSSVAAKPRQGVWGFLLGGLTWFAVPFTFATTMGLAYIALDARQETSLLEPGQIDQGLVAPVVAQRLMGTTGSVLILIMLMMAVTSTGSAEVIAVTSILVYDFYQLYFKPYRMVHDANTCILCGKSRGRNANPRDKCVCISMTYCAQCEADDSLRGESKRALKPEYKCKMHGSYRSYNDILLGLKNWCILWTTLSVIPITIILNALNVSLGWVYLFMGVLIGSAVIPIALCMCWARMTGVGMSSGAIGGSVLGLSSWLITASLQEGGLGDFLNSTGHITSMLVGNLCAIFGGGIISVVVTFATSRNYNPAMAAEVWENTRDIDNPLSPWTELYARDLNLTGANQLDNRPSLDEVKAAFKNASNLALGGAVTLTIILILLWPACMVSVGVMDLSMFTQWVNASAAWGILAMIFIIIMPIISETLEIKSALHEKRAVGDARVEAPVPNNDMPVLETAPPPKEDKLTDGQESKVTAPPEEGNGIRDPVFD